MKLSEILRRLRETPLVLPKFEQQNSNSGQLCQLDGLARYRKSLLTLAEIEPLKPFLSDLTGSDLVANNFDRFRLSAQEGAALHLRLGALQSALEGLMNILPAIIPEGRENCIRVKLPVASDYRTLVGDQGILLKALEQLLFIKAEFNHSITIEGWENGSFWLMLCVGAPLAVEVIGRALWAAAVIRKKMAEAVIIEEKVRALRIHGDLLEQLGAASKLAINEVINTEALAIHDKYFSGSSSPHEEVERIKKTLLTFADMISRGAEIHPALMQPEKAAEIFPDFKTLDTVSSKIPQLADSPSSSGDLPTE